MAMPLVTLLWVNFVRLRGKIKDMHWAVKVKVGRKGAILDPPSLRPCFSC